MTCIDTAAAVRRLNRIEGQVRGIKQMIESEKSCEEILIQIGSTKAALHKLGQLILAGHLHHCVVDAIRVGDADEAIESLTAALEQFSRLD